MGTVFLNTGAATADKAFIRLEDPSSTIVFNSSFHDSTVANTLDTADTLAAPDGVAPLSMH
jgi:hypothetical protein